MSWLETDGSDFTLENFPYGVCQKHSTMQHVPCSVIGDHIIDLQSLSKHGLLSGPHAAVIADALSQSTLNAFMACGRECWRELRSTLQRLFSSQEGAVRDSSALQQQLLLRKDEVSMQLPASIGDYTDFYASKEHATNVGALFRGRDDALSPNWVHLPVGYHGRASSIVVSGTPVTRPRGQVMKAGAAAPQLAACAALDFELEMAAFIGTGNALGTPIAVDDVESHVFGMVLMNDWSARDIQKWEYVPLGPFNGKNWATSISPWIVTLDALEPFRCDAPVQSPDVLPYLREPHRSTWNIQLQVDIVPHESPQHSTTITCTNFKYMYWSVSQMVAHHTVGGCNLCCGDLLGSGTISGPTRGELGCLLEMTEGGRKEIELTGGHKRLYLEDGDQVVLRGKCEDQTTRTRVGFGECIGSILPCS